MIKNVVINDGVVYDLSAGLVVVQVHQGDGVLSVLPALAPVLRVHKGPGEGHAKVDVVRTSRPLKILKL